MGGTRAVKARLTGDDERCDTTMGEYLYDVFTCDGLFFGGVVVINLSPLVCCVREIAPLLKSL